jgi:hypothetical protein
MFALIFLLFGLNLDISESDCRLNVNNLRLHCNLKDWSRYGFVYEMHLRKLDALSLHNYPITIAYEWDSQIISDLYIDMNRLSQMLFSRKTKPLQGKWKVIGFSISPLSGVWYFISTDCTVKNDVISMKLFGGSEWIIKTKRKSADILFSLPAPLTLAVDSTLAKWVGLRLLLNTKDKLYFKSLSSDSGPALWIFTRIED